MVIVNVIALQNVQKQGKRYRLTVKAIKLHCVSNCFSRDFSRDGKRDWYQLSVARAVK